MRCTVFAEHPDRQPRIWQPISLAFISLAFPCLLRCLQGCGSGDSRCLISWNFSSRCSALFACFLSSTGCISSSLRFVCLAVDGPPPNQQILSASGLFLFIFAIFVLHSAVSSVDFPSFVPRQTSSSDSRVLTSIYFCFMKSLCWNFPDPSIPVIFWFGCGEVSLSIRIFPNPK